MQCRKKGKGQGVRDGLTLLTMLTGIFLQTYREKRDKLMEKERKMVKFH